MFKPAISNEGKIWNTMTLSLFAAYIRKSTPLGTTKNGKVGSDSIGGYVSAIRLLRSREAGYDIAPDEYTANLHLVYKTWRREDGPAGDRRLCQGIRSAHIAKAAAGLHPNQSADTHIEYAAILASTALLLRGGEPGTTDTGVPDPRRIITWKKISWEAGRTESGGRLWLFVWVVAIKDTHARHKGTPLPVLRRHDGPFLSDPLCVYDAMAMAWWCRTAGEHEPFPTHLGQPKTNWWLEAAALPSPDQLNTAFFTYVSGEIFRTSTMRALARRVAELAGIDTSSVGAKSFRVGGATDLRALMGDAGKEMVKQRGRWASDVAEVYQRALLEEQLHASAMVGSVVSASIEEVVRGYAAPA